jgi:leucyl-tRNA synthetase
MHVLYARFFQKALASIGLAPDREPFTFRFNRSLIMGPDGQKMSKSKGNVIDPDAEVARYGADTVRMYLAFMGPYAEVNAYPWDPNGVTGIRRFLERVWSLAERVTAERTEASAPAARAAAHRAVTKVGEDIARFKFNTAIAAMMTAMNEIGQAPLAVADFEIFIRALAPFAPFTAAEIWETVLGRADSVHAAAWPEADQSALAAEGVKIAVQVNGKLRATLSVARGATEAELLPLALAEATVSRALNGAEPKRVIFVADKLLSIVA